MNLYYYNLLFSLVHRILIVVSGWFVGLSVNSQLLFLLNSCDFCFEFVSQAHTYSPFIMWLLLGMIYGPV